jgi:hypothetical protein
MTNLTKTTPIYLSSTDKKSISDNKRNDLQKKYSDNVTNIFRARSDNNNIETAINKSIKKTNNTWHNKLTYIKQFPDETTSIYKIYNKDKKSSSYVIINDDESVDVYPLDKNYKGLYDYKTEEFSSKKAFFDTIKPGFKVIKVHIGDIDGDKRVDLYLNKNPKIIYNSDVKIIFNPEKKPKVITK